MRFVCLSRWIPRIFLIFARNSFTSCFEEMMNPVGVAEQATCFDRQLSKFQLISRCHRQFATVIERIAYSYL